jgi:hypothetical protein
MNAAKTVAQDMSHGRSRGPAFSRRIRGDLSLRVVGRLRNEEATLRNPGDKIIRKLCWAYPAAMAATHIKNGVSNIPTQGASGCTPIECAEQMQ